MIFKKKKYHKIVELTSGVTTKIDDKLQGTIEVEYNLKPIYNERITKN